MIAVTSIRFLLSRTNVRSMTYNWSNRRPRALRAIHRDPIFSPVKVDQCARRIPISVSHNGGRARKVLFFKLNYCAIFGRIAFPTSICAFRPGRNLRDMQNPCLRFRFTTSELAGDLTHTCVFRCGHAWAGDGTA